MRESGSPELREMGTRIRSKIDERGLKQAGVAASVGVSPAMLSRVIAGLNRMRPEKMRRLAEILGVSFEWLQFGGASPAPVVAQEASERMTAQQFVESHGRALADREKEYLLGLDTRAPGSTAPAAFWTALVRAHRDEHPL